MLNASLFSSAKDNWETPSYLFAPLNREFQFTLDVAATADNAKCASFLVDGLTQRWSGVCWMNPPYGRAISAWVSRAREQVNVGATPCVVGLVPCRTDTSWWHSYVMKASEIRLLDKRLKFKGAGNMAPFPCAVVVWKPNSRRATLSSLAVQVRG